MKWTDMFALVSIVTVVSAAPLSLLSASNVTRPSQDPFYKPKEGYENANLGDILDSRQITHPYGVIIFPEHIAGAYQLQVRSQDSHGNPTTIVTTVLVPHKADPTKILSYQVAIDSPNNDCAPSYAMQFGSDASTWITGQIELLLSEGGLYDGWYVVVPDFLGPHAAFAAGIQAGQATLDSLKAVSQSGSITGVDSKAEIVLWGYSGGSQPSVWAAALAPTYAPEVNIIGAAAGGILVDPRHIAQVSMGTLWAGLVVEAINGLANEYPELLSYLKTTLYPEIQPQFFAANDRCLIGNIAAYLETTWDDISNKGQSVLDDPVVTKVTSANNLLEVSARPKIPLFFYNSANDEIIPASDTDELFTKWCSEGVSIEYRQDVISEHVTEAVFGAGDALVWLQDRFKHVPQVGCQKLNSVSNLLNPDSITGLAELLSDIVYLVAGDAVGPDDSRPAINFNNSLIKGTPTEVVSSIASKIGSLPTSTSLFESILALIL